ncbi:adenylate/guanylate cyclase domain-containing protein [Microbaculum marinum]|uniref:Adenylate/guanylate cyclase domain-containing protein n=1 Tax=Microbaculum marinum TaxID=1764581 RepID=A0AAW9RF11_9HYPH
MLGELPERLAVTVAEAGIPTYEDLVDLVSRGLNELGVPLWRTFIGIETLHPTESGRTVTWSEGEITTFHRERDGVAESHDYLDSPVRIVDETGEPLRIRLTETDLAMPTIVDMRHAGGTDYIIHPLPFVDDTRTAVISFATRSADGFSESMLARLAAATAVISPHIERLAVREIAVNLLDAYVGPRSGRRVFEGLIDRGDLVTVNAAILFADLRDYTALSERLPPAATVRLLDAWFETLGGPIEEHGGEILKFLGDGLLAVFPDDGGPAAACHAALAAALGADRGFARVPEAAGLGAGDIGYGIGLHHGEVGYGNVGTRRRLDFTVIGQAVNLASRLQDLSKRFPQTIMASAAFAAHVGEKLVPHGRHGLRGIARPVEVYAVR